jgi:O-antigen/teichoic acid export membrane protein
VWLLRERVNPVRGHPRRWWRTTRRLAGWFTATAVLGQVQTQVVAALVAGTLGSTAFAQFRVAQTAIVAPAQNLMMATMGLLVPRSARLAAAGDAAALRRQTRMLTMMLVVLGVGVLGTVVALAGPVLRGVLPGYAGVAPLALPLGVQTGIYLIQIPYAAALRGMHRARHLLVQYGIFSAASVTGLVIGIYTGGLTGSAWGLCAGAAVGLPTMIVMYRGATATLVTHQLISRADQQKTANR